MGESLFASSEPSPVVRPWLAGLVKLVKSMDWVRTSEGMLRTTAGCWEHRLLRSCRSRRCTTSGEPERDSTEAFNASQAAFSPSAEITCAKYSGWKAGLETKRLWVQIPFCTDGLTLTCAWRLASASTAKLCCSSGGRLISSLQQWTYSMLWVP